jgi:hypothetical protein
MMANQYKKLQQRDIEFIKQQKLFYIASCSGKEVNLSPKGFDTLYILDDERLIFMNYPGSTNRTYHDAKAGGEFTLLFNAFEGGAQILRVFCKAEVIEQDDVRYENYLTFFDVPPSQVRNIFQFTIYAVEPSCGISVPIMEYKGDRPEFKEWADDMDRRDELEAYKEKKFARVDLQGLE